MLFKTLSEILKPGVNVTIVVRKTGSGSLAVCTSLNRQDVGDGAADYIQPFVAEGSAEELDAQFAGIIAQPISESLGLQTSMAEFQASKKVAEANSAKAKEAAAAAEKEKTARKKLISDAEAAAKSGDKAKAKSLYEKALKTATEQEKKAIRKALEKLFPSNGGSVFGDEDEEDAPAEASASGEGSEQEPEEAASAESGPSDIEDPEEDEDEDPEFDF